jgi:hypothetical protein
MKNTTLLFLLLVHPLLGEQGKPAFRDAATNESLAGKYREVSKTNPMTDPKTKFTVTTGEDPSVKNKVGNLLENSEFITFNGHTTLVPKRAIIVIPDKYKDRINNHKEGSKIVSWAEFFSLNRGWISTLEVNFSQAKGEKPVNAEEMEVLNKSKNLIVAVLENGPISVLPLKTTADPVEPVEKTKP